MPGWKPKLALVALTLGIATWTGYRAERRTMDAAGRPSTTLRSVVRHVLAPKSRTDSLARLNALRHSAGRSLPTPREVRESWEIIRAFTVDDIQAALAEIPDGLRRPANQVLVSMLFYRWAQMDPQAAMTAARQPPYSEVRDTPYIILLPWIQSDPDGLIRWVKSSQDDLLRNMAAHNIAQHWVATDPDHALARAKAEFPEAEHSVVLTLTRHLSGTKESRQKLFQMLASTGDTRLQQRCLSQLRWCFQDQDPAVALAVADEVAASGLVPDRAEPFRKELTHIAMQERPQERLEWLMKPESQSDPDSRQNAYTSWAAEHPAEAIAWIQQNDQVDFLADTVKRITYHQLRAGWHPGDAARDGRWENSTHRQFLAWRAQQPAAAQEWLQTLPADIREAFTAAPNIPTAEDEATQ